MAQDKTRRSLRLRGKKWSLHKELPKRVQKVWGKRFLVRSLDTTDFVKAIRMRDRILREIEVLDEQLAASESTARLSREFEILAEFKALESAAEDVALPATRDHIQEYESHPAVGNLHGMENHLIEHAESFGGGLEWFERVTGKQTPILLPFETYLREQRSLVETTRKARRVAVRTFSEFMKDPVLSKVTKKIAGSYQSQLLANGLSQRTANSHISHLSSYWRWLVKKDFTKSNPWKDQHIKVTEKLERIPWEPEQIFWLINNAPSRVLKHGIAIAALTGARASEIAQLTVGDCKEGWFFIRGKRLERL